MISLAPSKRPLNPRREKMQLDDDEEHHFQYCRGCETERDARDTPSLAVGGSSSQDFGNTIVNALYVPLELHLWLAKKIKAGSPSTNEEVSDDDRSDFSRGNP